MQDVKLVDAINDAIGAHGMWKLRLRTAIAQGHSDITAAKAGCDDGCAFGQWLYGGSIPAAVKAGVPYGVIRRLHAEFHQSAGSVLAYVESKDVPKARQLLEGEFTQRSEKLVRALTKWKHEAGAVSRAA
ncbi:hypothetical protein EOE18_06675 [Novosphingobium umbonatum]|uniref:Chemoreceptor zinc-binding domain-containing protein n=1 Tax=Novosphingobium umbonatum TaxID=1908524 RepID=A0A3S2VDZ7_9SPHN|nr:CZB domain-containing protein [Novosphingobium umbonatum]RVU05673.1 hypothetical protein EOE18_06675 [Novosphingobium umbonatum]